MPTMNGIIKGQTGDELLPRTSFAQVRDEDEKLLSDWRAETDEAVSDLQTRDTELEESIVAVQNAIPDVSGLATKEDVQAVEGQIPDVSGMVTGVSYEESTGTLTLTGADNQTIATVTISTAGTVLKDAKLEQSEGSAMLSLEWQLVNGSTTTTTVDLSTLIDVYKEGTGIKVEDNVIAVDADWLAAQMPDTSDLATKAELAEVQSSIPDVSNLASKDEIPDISGLATTSALSEVEAKIPDISGLATTDEVEAAKEWTGVWQMGNFATLAAATLNLAYHEVYNNPERRIISFTVGAGTTGIVINQTFNPTSGLPYTARQYLYFDGHRYVRTVQRQSNGDVTSPKWTLDDGRGVFPGKGVLLSKLMTLTEENTSEQVQEALTYPNGDGVLTRDDLETCITTGLGLIDYDTNSPVSVGRTKLNGHYVLTYVGYTTVAASYAPDYDDPVIVSVILDVTAAGEYSVFKAANVSSLVREDDPSLPLNVYIPAVFQSSNNTSDSVKSEATILGYFGCTTVDELLEKVRATKLFNLVYLNSGTMMYRIPVHYFNLTNSKNTIQIVTTAPNALNADEPARLEVVMNLDGTTADGSSNNIYVGYTPFANESVVTAFESRIAELEAKVAALESGE